MIQSCWRARELRLSWPKAIIRRPAGRRAALLHDTQRFLPTAQAADSRLHRDRACWHPSRPNAIVVGDSRARRPSLHSWLRPTRTFARQRFQFSNKEAGASVGVPESHRADKPWPTCLCSRRSTRELGADSGSARSSAASMTTPGLSVAPKRSLPDQTASGRQSEQAGRTRTLPSIALSYPRVRACEHSSANGQRRVRGAPAHDAARDLEDPPSHICLRRTVPRHVHRGIRRSVVVAWQPARSSGVS